MKKLSILILGLTLLAGCATVKLDLPDQWGGIRTLCRATTFLILDNNRSYIFEVESQLKAAIERAHSPAVDAIGLLTEIQEACANLQIKFPKDAAKIAVILGEVKILIEQDSNRVAKLQSLLEGIRQGVELAKGV